MKIPGVIIIIATPDQRKQKAARGTKYTEESKMRRERIIQEKTHMYIYFTFGGETNVKKKKKKNVDRALLFLSRFNRDNSSFH